MVDLFLADFYRAGDRSFPPLGNVVTLSSPHEGAPIATVGEQVRSTGKGKAVLDHVEGSSPIPPPSSPAVRDLAEDSSVIHEVQDARRPRALRLHDHRCHRRLRGARDQHLAPGRDRDGRRGERRQRAQRHRAAPDALKAVRAALEGRPPPCVGLLTALRTAVSPVLISRVEHMAGDDAEFVLRGGLKFAP